MKTKRPAKRKPAATPDDLIRTSPEARIRLIARRLPRRRKPTPR